MVSLNRKIKRRHMKLMRKKFVKEFKKRMLEFKRQVKCRLCGYHPQPGENIDDWHIDKSSENINLVCTGCHSAQKENIEES